MNSYVQMLTIYTESVISLSSIQTDLSVIGPSLHIITSMHIFTISHHDTQLGEGSSLSSSIAL